MEEGETVTVQLEPVRPATRPMPRHIAVIPDGNRRWGDVNRLPRAAAYEQGERVIFATAEASRVRGIEWLTFFVFSTDNWRRDTQEVEYLVGGDRSLLYRMVRKRARQIHERNVRFRVIGERSSNIAGNALEALYETEELTRHNTGMNLVMAINYGGREELARAVRLAAGNGACATTNGIGAGTEPLSQHLYLPEMPDVDLLIRTADERRVSNYLMWQLSYAQFAFVRALWPDFGEADLEQCLADYAATERRFGR
jgi:undecaprenyl diphosphate synthase